jgi:rhodanese-related sulfurtransferase
MNPRGWTLSLVALSLFSLPAFAQESEKHTKDSLETVKKNIADGKAVLIDVREKGEWDAGHLKVAKLLEMSRFSDIEKQKEVAEKELDKSKIIYTHCKAGGRCASVAEILKKFGYDVRALKPGYEDLLKTGFEKAEPAKKEDPKKP